MPIVTRRDFLTAAGASALALGAANAAGRRPNILWLSCEDMSPNLGCWGDPHAITPNVDGLAAEGTRYLNAFTTAGVCAPSRSGIITGCYASTLGSHHMRSNVPLPAQVRCFPALLREAGYWCTNNSKTDYNFAVPRDAWDVSSNQAHWRGRAPGQPFFAVFNLTVTHESQYRTRGAEYEPKVQRLRPAERQDPARLTTLPPYYPDTPEARRDWAQYYECITAMDYQVGDRLRELAEAGLADDTIVFFWSDHGAGLPRAKRWPYDSGTHVPLIIRVPAGLTVPGHAGRGATDDRLLSLIDLAPTVLSLCGVARPPVMQGRPFLGEQAPPREYVHAARDRMDERYDCVRGTRDRRYRYVRNYQAWRPYYQPLQYMEQGIIMRELRRLHADGALAPGAEQWFAGSKPAEELYDTATDPHEQHNLAGDPAHATTLSRLRAAHEAWQDETLDLGLLPESEMLRLAAEYGTPYAIPRHPDQAGLLPKLRAAVRLAEQGTPARDAMIAALADPIPAVRWWAATGLGNLHAEAAPAADELLALRADPIAGVRIAAARALARLGHVAEALEVLLAALNERNRGVLAEAATVLDEMGELARPAIPALREAFEAKRDEYLTRLSEHALGAFGELR